MGRQCHLWGTVLGWARGPPALPHSAELPPTCCCGAAPHVGPAVPRKVWGRWGVAAWGAACRGLGGVGGTHVGASVAVAVETRWEAAIRAPGSLGSLGSAAPPLWGILCRAGGRPGVGAPRRGVLGAAALRGDRAAVLWGRARRG